MSELMERESIDDIARRAVAAARRDVSTKSLLELRPGVRRPRFVPLLALVVVAVVVAGLVAIGTNRDQSSGNQPAGLHWLLRDLPAGWAATSAYDSTPDPAPPMASSGPFVGNLYATSAEPLGPFLNVQGTTDTSEAITVGSYSGEVLAYEEFTLDGKRAAFATLANGARGLYVEINGNWTYLSSRGLSDDQLRGLARTLTPDATGHYDVAASALPTGMHKIDTATRRDYASVDYAPAGDGTATMQFSVARASTVLTGVGMAGYDFTTISTGAFNGFIGNASTPTTTPPTTAWIVLWKRDGLQFMLTGQNVTRDQILNAATTASTASADEWDHLLGLSPVEPATTVVTGTSPVADTSDTAPSVNSAPHDAAITVAVDDVSNNEEHWSGSLPTGETWTATIIRVYDRMDIRYTINGTIVESGSGTSTAFPGTSQVTCCNPIVMTRDPNAVALRVLRVNGDRYTIPLHDLPGGSGVRIALIAIPETAIRTELIDSNGNVLQSYTP